MGQIKAILFDAAGTLLHAHPSVGHVYAAVVARHGAAADPVRMEAAFRAAFASKREQPRRRASPAHDPLQNEGYDWWRELVFEVMDTLGLTVRDREAFFHELYWRFADPDVWRLYPDALPALRGTRARGLKVALVSNWDVRLRRLVEGMGIIGLFDTIVISTEVGCEKPDPRIFQIACERLAVQPAAAVHVGDHLREDIEGAKAAGVQAVFLDRKRKDGKEAIADLREVLTRV